MFLSPMASSSSKRPSSSRKTSSSSSWVRFPLRMASISCCLAMASAVSSMMLSISSMENISLAFFKASLPSLRPSRTCSARRKKNSWQHHLAARNCSTRRKLFRNHFIHAMSGRTGKDSFSLIPLWAVWLVSHSLAKFSSHKKRICQSGS